MLAMANQPLQAQKVQQAFNCRKQATTALTILQSSSGIPWRPSEVLQEDSPLSRSLSRTPVPSPGCYKGLGELHSTYNIDHQGTMSIYTK